MAVTIGPFHSQPYVPNVSVQPKVESRPAQQNDVQLNAPGRSSIGEQGKQNALQQLSKLLQENNFSVSSTYDSKSGLQEISIVDGRTVSRIAQLPVPAVKDIAERAKQSHLGWLIDKMA